jgi:DNA-binding XRE family transcriptional regulator
MRTRQQEVNKQLVALGGTLKAARATRALTQEQVASEIGIHRHTLRAIENGNPGVSIFDWLAVCDFMHVTLDVKAPVDVSVSLPAPLARKC